MNKNWKTKFMLVAIGQTVSLVGSSAVQFALIWWITQETSSAIMLGLSGMAAYLPMILLSPVAGIVADKYNRKMICIIADLTIGVSALIYAIVLDAFSLPVWSALIVLFLRGAVGTFHQPSIQSIIPQLVPAEYLVKANGWTQLMQSGSFMLGPVIGAALFASFSLPVVLMTDLIGAVAASIALAFVIVPKIETQRIKDEKFMVQFKEGLQIYRQDRKLFNIIAAQTLCMVFFLPLSTFYPLMSGEYFKLTAWHASVVELSFAAGMMAVALLFGSVLKIRNKIAVAYLGLLGIGISAIISGLLPPVFAGWLVFVAVCAVLGGFGNVHSIPLTAYMQETIPPEKMGRAFSVLGLIGSLTMPIGLFVGSPIAEVLGVHTWFLISGIGMTLISIIFGLRYRKDARKTQ